MAKIVDEICRMFPKLCEVIPWIGNQGDTVEEELPTDTVFRRRLQDLEDQLQVPGSQITPDIRLRLAEIFREYSLPELALVISRSIPPLLDPTDVATTRLLARATFSQARSLDMLQRHNEADAAFALAEHLNILARRLD